MIERWASLLDLVGEPRFMRETPTSLRVVSEGGKVRTYINGRERETIKATTAGVIPTATPRPNRAQRRHV